MNLRKHTKKSVVSKKRNRRLDQLEAVINEAQVVECPIIHRFTPGMYIREMWACAGTLLTSKIHLSEHPFVLSKGKLSVWHDSGKEEIIEAPYCGITKRGTRRIILIHQDAVFTTFHATDKTTPEEVEDDIIEPHINSVTGTNIFDDYQNKLLKQKEVTWHSLQQQD